MCSIKYFQPLVYCDIIFWTVQILDQKSIQYLLITNKGTIN